MRWEIKSHGIGSSANPGWNWKLIQLCTMCISLNIYHYLKEYLPSHRGNLGHIRRHEPTVLRRVCISDVLHKEKRNKTSMFIESKKKTKHNFLKVSKIPTTHTRSKRKSIFHLLSLKWSRITSSPFSSVCQKGWMDMATNAPNKRDLHLIPRIWSRVVVVVEFVSGI